MKTRKLGQAGTFTVQYGFDKLPGFGRRTAFAEGSQECAVVTQHVCRRRNEYRSATHLGVLQQKRGSGTPVRVGFVDRPLFGLVMKRRQTADHQYKQGSRHDRPNSHRTNRIEPECD